MPNGDDCEWLPGGHGRRSLNCACIAFGPSFGIQAPSGPARAISNAPRFRNFRVIMSFLR